jgi:hypothetical protein
MTVGSCVRFENKGWEEDEHSKSKHPNESTTLLMLVNLKAVQGVAEVTNMEAIGKSGSWQSHYQGLARKNHCPCKPMSQDWIVGDKGRFVRDHVVGRA